MRVESIFKKNKELRDGNNRSVYMIGFTFFFLVVLFLLTSPFLRVTLELETTEEGSIQLYYGYSRSNEPSFGSYDTETSWLPISPETKKIEFSNIPVNSNVIRIDVDGTNKVNISKMKVSIWGIELKQLDGIDLNSNIHKSSELNISLDENQLVVDRMADNAYLILDSNQYFTAYHWIMIVFLFVVCSVMISFIVIRFITNLNLDLDYILREANLCTAAIAMFIFSELIAESYWYMHLQAKILNVVFIYIIYKLIYLIIYSKTISIMVGNIVFAAFGCANYYLIKFRGKPFLPWDFSAISTAKQVASGYTYNLTIPMVLAVFLMIILLVLVRQERKPSKNHSRRKYTVINLALIIILGLGGYFSSTYGKMQVHYWNSDVVYLYRIQGSTASFFKYAENMKIPTPKGYSIEKVKNIITEVEKEEEYITDSQKIQPTNVIMVMNESYSNLNGLGNSISDDVMQYYDNLVVNVIKGNLYVSVRGGGTCNTEFETLTGNSMLFFPSGSYPFQNFIKGDTSSLASYFNNMNYATTGLHLENPNNWNRKSVYPKLGFKEFYSLVDFDGVEMLRNLATDEYNYSKLIELYESNKQNKQFIYNVTLQNHGGYSSFENVEPTVSLDLSGGFSSVQLYLSLIRLSNQAFGELINYYEKVSEPTMIIMYGDHQPTLGGEVDEWLSLNSEEDGQNSSIFNQYVTPFVIWTNYDIEEQYIEKMSANYLSSLILKTGNFKLPSYNKFLLELFEKYPVITQQGILDSNNNFYSDKNELDGDTMIQQYEYLQYNNLFDKKRISECFE